jgi:polysaccharide pyruvyl transferase WcaK-like protein
MHRRHFLHTALAAALASTPALAAGTRKPRIVLRSSWQTVNIGDIGHTPGVLALVEKHLPDVEVLLWPSNVDNGVEGMLLRRFPWLTITRDRQAIYDCDFLLHGSGPFLVAHRDVAAWKKDTGKPYGIYGITMAAEGDPQLKSFHYNGLDAYCRELLDTASFLFLRDSRSLEVVKQAGVRCPVVEFGPDGAFACDLRNEAAAIEFLREHQLEEGRFLCTIPRLRRTPYWLVRETSKFDETKHRRNEEMKEHDHALLREGILAVVRETDLKVLVCPEDATQMQEGKSLLIDPLPEAVKERVVWRKDYWLTDEALSIYTRSAGLFGNEMHSPIMCIGNGVPAIVCRFAEQTSKGFMWEDIGLGDWLFDLDETADRLRLPATVLEFAKDPAKAKAKAQRARQFVEERQRETMQMLERSV